MAEHGKLAAEVVIDADNLFLEIRGRVVAADKRRTAVGIHSIRLGENSRIEQRRGVSRNHAGWNDVARERRSLHNSRGSYAAGAIGKEDVRSNLRGARNVDDGGIGTEITTIGGRVGNRLIRQPAVDISTPFHVVKKESLGPVRVVELAE